jgi:hypothetical protein
MTGLRLCRDCRWKRRQFLLPPACGHHAVSPVLLDVVSGATPQKREWCSSARGGEACGADGRLWEQRQ